MGDRSFLAPLPQSKAATQTVHAAGPKHGEMGHSGADLDLAQVTAEIARAEKQPTLEKVARFYGTLKERMAENRKQRGGPRSPEVLARMDAEYAEMERKAAVAERMVWGRSNAEALNQQLINFGIAPGQKAELAEKPLLPTDADMAAKLEKLKAKREALLATIIERQQARRAAELKRAAKKPVGDEERLDHIVRDMGVQVKRPLTDFEAAIAEPPSSVPANAPRGWGRLGHLVPMINHKTGEPVAYVYSSNGYHETYDIMGNFLGSGEVPVEPSAIQPDDLLLLKAPASILLKGAQGGLKYFASRAPRAGASLLRSARTGAAATMIGTGEVLPAYSRALPAAGMMAERETASLATRGAQSAMTEASERATTQATQQVTGVTRAAVAQTNAESLMGLGPVQRAAIRDTVGKPLSTPSGGMLAQVWASVANPGEAASLTGANSRRLFNNQRNRFWNAVRNDPQALKVILDMGGVFSGGPTSAPVITLPDGTRMQLTIDHIVERQSAPGRALDPTNLQLSPRRENTVLLRQLHDQDPFQDPASRGWVPF